MINLRDDPYTENDIKENIDNGNIYIKPNIRGTLSIVKEYESHPVDSEWLIGFGTLSIDLTLAHEQTEDYLYFKDGSYIRAVLKPTWTEGPLQLVTVIAYEAFFGIKQDDGTITEIRYLSATGLPGYKTKYIWEVDETSPSGGEWVFDRNINYMVGDKFNISLGWWDDGIPKSRSFFIVKTAGGGAYNYEDYMRFINPNILSSGVQLPVYYDTVERQKIAAYLSGNKTEGTEYPGEDSTEGGGHGEFYNENEDVDFPAIPSLQAIDLGFTTLYNPHEADVRAISAWLWTDDFVQNIKMNYTDPLNNILGINFCPLPEGLIKNEQAEFVVGDTRSGISTLKVKPGNKNQYVELDCGERVLTEYWQNFLDYNSSFMIWLPFIGFRQLRPDDILQATRDTGGSLKVKYIIDLLTGCAVCNIISVLKDRLTNKLVKHLLYSYTCNVFYSTPLSGANYMSMYNQQLNATASGISNLVSSIGQMASGNIGGAVSGLVNLFTGQAQAQRQYETAKPEYGRSGNSGGNSGYFSFKKPYIIKTNPIGQTPKNYNSLEGVPSMIYSKLSKLEGYTEINTINLDSLNASSAEKSELLTIMKSGFYI